MRYTPRTYQSYTTQFILDNPAAGIFLDMGLGKTVSTLTAIDLLLHDTMEADKVLVIAPLMVASTTWAAEVAKWDHLQHLRVSRVLGSERKRLAALEAQADLYVVNRENVKWLVEHYKSKWPFDTVVIDELSSFKNGQSQRFKALRKVRPLVKRIVGLTGTPAPNSLLDLWAQLYLLDQGERLGKFVTRYRDKYFLPGRRNGMIVYDWKLRDGADHEIHEKIGDICVTMRTEDYLELPERIDRMVELELPPKAAKQYKEFERTLVMQMQGSLVTAVNAASLAGKLLQMANGAVYDEQGAYHEVHDSKIQALQEIVDVASGKPVLVFYSYRHDLERIQKHISGTRVMKTSEDVGDWNAGKVGVMLAHPASAGHGLNLQAGGNIIVWFGLPWSLEQYQQANKRLHRSGQQQSVIVHHLLCKGTIDEHVLQVLQAKDATQQQLIEAIKARIETYKKQTKP